MTEIKYNKDGSIAKKRGRPKKQPIEVPQEVKEIIEKVQNETPVNEEPVIKEVIEEPFTGWDVPKTEHIKRFDKRLSYELTGYKPITATKSLDFRPEWFTVARDTFIRTGKYCAYPFGSKIYNEFWNEEHRRCREGYTVNGYTLTGPNYYYLNYYQLPNIDVEKAGSGRLAVFPRFLVFQYEFFHYFEICRILKKDVCLMKARGVGFSEINAAICANIYNCFRESNCMITAQLKNYLDKSLNKAWGALAFANDNTNGGMFKLTQVHNTQYLKKSSWYKKENGQDIEVGWKSQIEGVVADTDAKIRGDRVDLLVYEEAGSNTALRKSYIKGKALIYIGGKKFGIRMCGGTGGDKGVALADLADMYNDPESFDVLPFYHNYTPTGDWVESSYFIPSYIGAVTEFGEDSDGVKRRLLDERGYCLWENYKEQLDLDRSKIKNPKALIEHCAEYCYNAEEAFALEGENKFNKVLIAEQLMRIRVLKQCPKFDYGVLKFNYASGKQHTHENVNGVTWQSTQQGPGTIKILEHPLWECPPKKDENGMVIWNPPDKQANLYVAGCDGIDLGKQDTSEYTKDPSDFCIVIYKRAFGIQDPQIVAIYKDRPQDIREAHETAIKLAIYYNCLINIEASRVSLVGYCRDRGWLNYLMKRPSICFSDVTRKHRAGLQYGVPATLANIDHHTDLTRDYINDFSQSIWFEEFLVEANKYSDEEKRKFDIIAATGMALMGNEELGSLVPKAVAPVQIKYNDIGYYKDERGVRHFGVIPDKYAPKLIMTAPTKTYGYGRQTNPRYRDY